MKVSTAKKYRKKHRLLGALILRNPVLVMGLDLPFIIACAYSLKNAAAMSIQIIIIHVVTMTFATFTCRKLPLWLRALVNVCIATTMMMVARILILSLFSGISNSLGMYLYLMAVNGMTMVQSNRLGKKAKIWPVFTDAIFNALGFSLVAFVVSLIREYFGNATIWGVAVASPLKLGALLIPFSGFILTGFLLALTKFANRRLGMRVMRNAEINEAKLKRIKIASVEIID